jgi:2-oxoglutarate dehydrogenase complex dehydrogenase (E1) component-like enzyme
MVGIDGSGASRLRTETIALKCLSPEQAADIINPYVRSHGSNYYIGNSGVAAITVRGTADELAMSRDLIRQFESDPQASCHASLADKFRELQGVMDALQPEQDFIEPQPEAPPPGAASKAETAVPLPALREMNDALLRMPTDFTIHRKLERVRDKRIHMLDNPDERTVDWSAAEDLAFASILKILTMFTSQHSVTFGDQMRNAAFFARTTAARAGRKFCFAIKTQALLT